MNRRQLIAIGGIGAASIAGCTALADVFSPGSDSSEDTDEEGGQQDDPSISAEQVNSTDEPPQEREETTPEDASQTENESTDSSKNESENETGNESQNAVSQPDGDAPDAIEFVEHEMVFDEATDPNYEQDELFLRGIIRNTSEHPLQGVRLDGYAYVGDEEVGHEYIEYAQLEAGGNRRFEIPFYVENPSEVEKYTLEVTAAEWA